MKLKGGVLLSLSLSLKPKTWALFVLLSFGIFFSTLFFIPKLEKSQAAGLGCTSAQAGNWSDAATWTSCGGGVPGAADNAAIAHMVTLTGDVNITTGTITVNNGGTLDTSGSNYAISTAGLTINAGGIVTANGSNITLSGTGTPLVITGTFTPGNSTINYTGGTTATNITSTTYYNLYLDHASTVYTAAGDITVSNVFTINAGTFDASSRTITLSGATGTPFVKTGTFTPSTSTVKYTGNYASGNTVVVPTTYNSLYLDNAAEIYGAASSFAVGGTFTINAGTFLPAAAAIISGAGTLTGSGTAQVSRTAATAGFLQQYTITNKTYTNLTVEYVAAAAQTVSAVAYGNLKISNTSSAVATLGGTVSVSGVLTISSGGTLAGSSNILNLSGNTGTPFVNNGIFTPGTSTVDFLTDTAALPFSGITAFYILKFEPTLTASRAWTIPALTMSAPTNTFTINPTASSAYSLTVTLGGDLNLTNAANSQMFVKGTNSATSVLDTSGSNYAINAVPGTLYVPAGGTVVANNSLITLGAFSLINGTFTPGGSTLIFAKDAAVNPLFSLSSPTTVYNVQISPTITAPREYKLCNSVCTINIGGTFDINPNSLGTNLLTVNSSSLPTLTVTGATTIERTGSATSRLITNVIPITFSSISIASGGNFAPGTGIVDIAGNWDNTNGTFTADSSTINLSGAGGTTQVIFGSTTFNNLTSTATTARTINFASGTTQTVAGTWTATGTAPDEYLTLGRDGGSGSDQWQITPTAWSVDYVTPTNSKNNAALPINPTHYIGESNTTNWFPVPADPTLASTACPTQTTYCLDTTPDITVTNASPSSSYHYLVDQTLSPNIAAVSAGTADADGIFTVPDGQIHPHATFYIHVIAQNSDGDFSANYATYKIISRDSSGAGEISNTTAEVTSETDQTNATLPTTEEIVIQITQTLRSRNTGISTVSDTTNPSAAPTIDLRPNAPTITNITAKGAALWIEGKSDPGTTIYFTIHSNPFEGQGLANSDGYWTYYLDNASEILGAGDHTIVAQAAIKLADNTELRGAESKTYDFKINVDDGKLKVEIKKTRVWQYICFGLVLLIVAGFALMRAKKRRQLY